MSQNREWRRALGDVLSPGDVVAGKYRLDRLIGIGGMGVVAEAWHVDLEQKVAIKLLHPARAGKERTRKRFVREGRAGFSMRSEHVARVLDMGTTSGGVQYLAMELLEGSNFAELLRARGTLPPAVAVGYLLQICEAVAEAHALDLIHRDLKPDNLFLTHRADHSPCVKVLDFGLAKVQGAGDALTRAQRGMGTPRYMSPEQWVSARDVGPATDIWALGVVLFELVAGRCPFDKPDANDLCQAILFQPAPKLSSALPAVPAALDAVIDRCLQKKPPQRHRSVAELATALLPFAPTLAEAALDGVRPGGEPLAAIGSPWALTLSQPKLDGAESSKTQPSDTTPDSGARASDADQSGPGRSGPGQSGADQSDPGQSGPGQSGPGQSAPSSDEPRAQIGQAAADDARPATSTVTVPQDRTTTQAVSVPEDEAATLLAPRPAVPGNRGVLNTVPMDDEASEAPETLVRRRWPWQQWTARQRALALGIAAVSSGALLGLLTLPGPTPQTADRARRAEALPAASAAAPETTDAASPVSTADAGGPEAASAAAADGGAAPSSSSSVGDGAPPAHRKQRRGHRGHAAATRAHGGRKWVPPAL